MLKENKIISINIFLVILIFLAAILQVVILNRDSTSGEKLTKINLETEKIEKENDRFSQQIASASSISTISSKAINLGLMSNRLVLSLSSPQKLAQASVQ